MATANRVFWETVTFVALILAIFGVWTGSRLMAKRQIRLAAEQQEADLAQERAAQSNEIADLKKTAAGWAEQLAQAEAEAAFESFAAGIHYASNQRWGRVLGDARDQFRRVPKVEFAHLATASGRVIFSTTPDRFPSGRLEEQGSWALASTALRSRPGSSVGITELAGPVGDGAVLWIGYDTAAAQRTGRPGEFAATEPPVEAPLEAPEDSSTLGDGEAPTELDAASN